MTLKKRMLLHIGSMIGGCLIVAFAALWGIEAQRQSLSAALQGHHQLRQVYEVGTHIATARTMLSSAQLDIQLAAREAKIAAAKLQMIDQITGSSSETFGQADQASNLELQVRPALLESIAHLQSPIANSGTSRKAIDQSNVSLNKALNGLATAAAEIRQEIQAEQQRADARRRSTWLGVFALSAMVIVASSWIGIAQYRSVMNPLNRLGASARRIAAGHLDERVASEGDREFTSLATDFNRMAEELSTLCHDLERQVAAKSKELSQSERLASVGYLATGVAHEINNPLGIIAGYGERSLRILRRGLTESTAAGAARAIQVICDEAFRCKRITDQLLSLARPSQENRAIVSLANIVREVVSNFAGLPEYTDRTLVAAVSEDDASLHILGRAGEIKQVVINLVVNALQAVPGDGTGRVRVGIERMGEHLELTVTDNGRGMSPETRDRVFEPFFTTRRGDTPGVGLGLSIAHAIVREHGGSLRAESQGLGFGSRFIVRIPAAASEVTHVDN